MKGSHRSCSRPSRPCRSTSRSHSRRYEDYAAENRGAQGQAPAPAPAPLAIGVSSCQRERISNEGISNDGKVPSTAPPKLHFNDDFCFICKNVDGTLLCCDKCKHAFHEECLGLKADSLPDPWFCELCCSGSSEGGVPSAPPSEMQLKKTRGGKSIGKTGYYWTTNEECCLLNWFNASGLDFIHNNKNDFREIAAEIGCTERACRDKLTIIVGARILTQDVMNVMMAGFRIYEYNQDVPFDMRLENLPSVDNSISSFQERQDYGARAFHLSQVPPSEMSRLNKALFIQLNPSL